MNVVIGLVMLKRFFGGTLIEDSLGQMGMIFYQLGGLLRFPLLIVPTIMCTVRWRLSLPKWSVSQRKTTLEKAAIAIPAGLNMLTNTGPFLFMHHAVTENVTTLPAIAE